MSMSDKLRLSWHIKRYTTICARLACVKMLKDQEKTMIDAKKQAVEDLWDAKKGS